MGSSQPVASFSAWRHQAATPTPTWGAHRTGPAQHDAFILRRLGESATPSVDDDKNQVRATRPNKQGDRSPRHIGDMTQENEIWDSVEWVLFNAE